VNMLEHRQRRIAIEHLSERWQDGLEFGHGQFDFHGIPFVVVGGEG
jgi:hypothetical protein